MEDSSSRTTNEIWVNEVDDVFCNQSTTSSNIMRLATSSGYFSPPVPMAGKAIDLYPLVSASSRHAWMRDWNSSTHVVGL